MNLAPVLKSLAQKQPLTEDGARLVAGALMDGGVPEMEQGALLAFLNERPADLPELTGEMQAVSERCFRLPPPAGGVRPVVLASHIGAADRPNLMPLLALSLHRLHVPVLVHGVLSASGGVVAAQVLRELGLLPTVTLAHAAQALQANGIAYVPTAAFAPGIARLLALRERAGFGLYAERLARFVDPFAGGSLLVVAAADVQERGLLRTLFLERQGACLLLEAARGDAYADPHRRPALELVREGRSECLFEAEVEHARGAASVPRACDARSTASWTRAVLRGESPMPLPLVNQIACCLYGSGYTVDMNQAKAIAAVQTGSLLAA